MSAAEPVGKALLRTSIGNILETADGGEPEAAQAFLGGGPDAVELAHGKLAQTTVDIVFGERGQPAGLVELGGQLGEQPGGADADRTGEAKLAADELLDLAGDLLR